MRKIALLVAIGASLWGGYYAHSRYEVQGIDHIKLRPRGQGTREASLFPETWSNPEPFPLPEGEPDPMPAADVKRAFIRIATFNFGPWDHNQAAKRHVLASVVQVIRRFDVVAVQDIRAPNQGLLIELVDEVNSGGRRYDCATCPTLGREPTEQYSAFFYDKSTVHIDPGTVCSVSGQKGLFRRPPLVASFRARGPSPAEAFTFTMVNVFVDRNRASTELDLLDDVFRAVRDDGRGEDDVILVGDVVTYLPHLGELGDVPNLTAAVSEMPTAMQGIRTGDNLLFDRLATVEFTGRAEAVDLMREFNLSMRDALEVSQHLPVWAEFSVFEGGQPNPLAITP